MTKCKIPNPPFTPSLSLHHALPRAARLVLDSSALPEIRRCCHTQVSKDMDFREVCCCLFPGALPETMALSRYWRGSMTPVSVVRLGSAAASRVDFVAELVMSFDRVLWGLARAERCLVFLLTQHILIFKYVDTLDQKPA